MKAFIDLKIKGKTQVVVEFSYDRDIYNGKTTVRAPVNGAGDRKLTRFVDRELSSEQDVYAPDLGGSFSGRGKSKWSWLVSVCQTLIRARGGAFDEMSIRKAPADSLFKKVRNREGVVY